MWKEHCKFNTWIPISIEKSKIFNISFFFTFNAFGRLLFFSCFCSVNLLQIFKWINRQKKKIAQQLFFRNDSACMFSMNNYDCICMFFGVGDLLMMMFVEYISLSHSPLVFRLENSVCESVCVFRYASTMYNIYTNI